MAKAQRWALCSKRSLKASPGFCAWDGSLFAVVDQSYVKRDAVLHDGGAEVAVPLVQGGGGLTSF